MGRWGRRRVNLVMRLKLRLKLASLKLLRLELARLKLLRLKLARLELLRLELTGLELLANLMRLELTRQRLSLRLQLRLRLKLGRWSTARGRCSHNDGGLEWKWFHSWREILAALGRLGLGPSPPAFLFISLWGVDSLFARGKGKALLNERGHHMIPPPA